MTDKQPDIVQRLRSRPATTPADQSLLADAADTIIELRAELSRLQAADKPQAAQQCEPDMGHPKIQALLGRIARLEIELRLIGQAVHASSADELADVFDNDYGTKLLDDVKALKSQVLAAGGQGADGVSDEVLTFAIQVEKLLCEKLGRKWSTAGISIESLVDELASRAAPAHPPAAPASLTLTDDEIVWLISPVSSNSASHDIEFARRVIDAINAKA